MPVTPRCPETIRAGKTFARCHRPPGHKPPCHAAGCTWHSYGDAGQRLTTGTGCFPDCIPLPIPQTRKPRKKRTRNSRTAARRNQ
jgi:hypothetical protein